MLPAVPLSYNLADPNAGMDNAIERWEGNDNKDNDNKDKEDNNV